MLVASSIPVPTWVEDSVAAEQLLSDALQADVVAFDTETTGLNIVSDRAVMWSLAFGRVRAALPAATLPLFRPLFSSAKMLVGHNIKFDMHMVENSGGGTITCPVYDTHVMAGMENNERKNKDLKSLAGDGLFYPTDPRYIKYDSIFGGKVKNVMDATALYGHEAVVNYASKDAWATLVIFEELQKRLSATGPLRGRTLWDIYVEEEVPFTQVLYSCERAGIMVDLDYLQTKAAAARAKIASIAEAFVAQTRMPMNLDSPKQLAKFFYETLKRPVKKRTKGGKTGVGQPSVDEFVLHDWAQEGCPFSAMILEYRHHGKILSTYLVGLAENVDRYNRIHTTLVQGGAETGRLSSRDPNLQNIPRNEESADEAAEQDFYRLRHAFIAPPGYALLGADYDQLEMRIAAEISGEDSMIDMINKGWDVHMANASLMYDVPYEMFVAAAAEKKEVEKTKGRLSERAITVLGYRQDSKTIGFGLLYGQQAPKLAAKLKCSIEEAEAKIDRYFSRFPKMQQCIERVHSHVTAAGSVRTYSGRIRYLSDGMQPADKGKYFRALRQSFNTIIQGTAADIVRLAMIKCYQSQELRDLDCKMLLQIHDELLFYVPEDYTEEAKKLVKQYMEAPYQDEFRVHITATPKTGRRWTEVH